MTRAIRVHRTGDASVLQLEDVEVSPPGAGEVQVKHTALGLNFIDVYYRSGLYPTPLPMTPGQEAAGVVVSVGPGVSGFVAGDRVAYAGAVGAYADVRNVKAEVLVKVPDGIDDVTAAAVLLKGMTAHMLLFGVRDTKRGETLLFHAAAGGVGQLVTQWARHVGATVIGSVGSAAKVELAARHCDHVVTTDGDWVAAVKSIAPHGVDAAFDSIGKDTLLKSLDAVRDRGMLVSFGQSSGKPPPIEMGMLGGHRSLFVTRPSLHGWNHDRASLESRANALFEALKRGAVKVATPTQFKLSEVADAHRALEGRKTTGSVVLIP
ncbi:MAG: quinone oxidoreductase [Archangium gephyra]|uniref:Quinone oxidoreductase n=1 Tax=Archangium gephyra TaxID=48 RepID=A0A2W5SQ73_9BACT|nr:MAG: quinone oxidoreductase [Archangium gephyra]